MVKDDQLLYTVQGGEGLRFLCCQRTETNSRKFKIINNFLDFKILSLILRIKLTHRKILRLVRVLLFIPLIFVDFGNQNVQGDASLHK